MTHDKFCATVTKGIPGIVAFPDYLCNCEEIAAIRADEREQAVRRAVNAWDAYIPVAFGSGYGPWIVQMIAAVRGGAA